MEVAWIAVAVEMSATDDFWIRPTSPRRLLVIVWMAVSRAPVSSSPVVPFSRAMPVGRRSPAATLRATLTAAWMGVEKLRARARAATVTPRIVASARPTIAARCHRSGA